MQVGLEEDLRPVPHDRTVDDTARFLAGMPGREGSPFKPLEERPGWIQHARELDASWNHLDTGNLALMREFAAKVLGVPEVRDSVLFYPFSGPDTLTLMTLFPNNRTYIMVALEPAGTLPPIEQFKRADADKQLALLRETVDSVLRRSFFITRDMDRQFRGQVTDGLVPPIIHLLVRSRCQILGLRYVRLDEQGNVVERPARYTAPGSILNKGVEIEFIREGAAETKKLYYFSANLADERFRNNKPFHAFLERRHGVASFFKGTSYMPHQKGFTAICQEVLDNSKAILQDDSGLPFRLFDARKWDVQLYGKYDKPYGSFAYLEQPDLKKAYLGPATHELTFRIGYGYSRIPSNLQFATRRAEP